LKNNIVTIRKTHPHGPNHTHGLKDSDIRKKSTEITEFIEEEAIKGYRAPAIKDAAMDHFDNKQIGIEFLQLESILNAQHKVRGGLNAPFIGVESLQEDLKESVEWLKSNDYYIERFEEPEYQGFTFATADNLKILQKSGHLIIMDSTHKTNKHGWKLYTVLIRDSFGSWLPGGHFFVSGEEYRIVTKGLQILKRWAKTWKPRYFIVDLSSIEENAINHAFPGLRAGEQEIGIFYCTWHSRKALQRNLESYGKGYELMLQAMYKITRIGCEQIVEEAIAKLPVEPKKSYIRRYWLKNTAKWGMWSRQHSPLLLQMTSTSPVESYHAVLKKKGNASFGLIGACRIVSMVDESYFNRAQRVQFDFWTKSLTDMESFPFLAGFPHPIQLLLVDEIHAFNKRIEDGKEIPNHQTAECRCQFFRRYLLPCRHLFHRNLHGDFLKDQDWDAFRNMFAECGFDVYISRMRVIEEREEDPLELEAGERRLEFYAVVEEVREHWFELEAEYRRTGDANPLNNIIEQLRGVGIQDNREVGGQEGNRIN
jgi:MULE transposase domain